MSERRKYLPAEAYRFLALAALAHADGPLTKGALAWETRANHYMATRVLRELDEEKLVEAKRRDDGGFDVVITSQGRAFFEEHAPHARRAFRATLVEHFRYGRPPVWAAALVEAEE